MAVTAVAPVSWGATYWVTGHALPAGEPVWGGAMRALPAGLLLLAVVRSARRGLSGAWWWRAAVLGTLVNGAFFALVYASAQLLPSSVATTVSGAAPLVVVALAWRLLGERPRRASLVAATAGPVGVVLLVSGAASALDGVGVAVALAGVLAFCTGSVLSQRWAREAAARGERVPAPMVMVTWQLVLSGLLLVPVAVAVEGAPPALDGPALLALAVVSVVATAAAFACWFAGLAHLAAGAVALVGLLNPVTGVLMGIALGGERLTLPQGLGLALVLGSVLGGVLADRRRGVRPGPPVTARSA